MSIIARCLTLLVVSAWMPSSADAYVPGTSVDFPASPAYLSAADFRASAPEPAGLDEAIAAFDKANALLLENARDGAGAQVALVFPDASTSYGRDYFFSGPPIRLHEIRAGYESIAIGNDVCSRDIGKQWGCIQDSFWIGLRPLIRDAIVSWGRGQFLCEQGTCNVYRIVQAATLKEDGNLSISSDPDANHYDFAIFTTSDGSLLMSTESRTVNGRIAEPIASFVYDFKSPVASFDLPQH